MKFNLYHFTDEKKLKIQDKGEDKFAQAMFFFFDDEDIDYIFSYEEKNYHDIINNYDHDEDDILHISHVGWTYGDNIYKFIINIDDEKVLDLRDEDDYAEFYINNVDPEFDIDFNNNQNPLIEKVREMGFHALLISDDNDGIDHDALIALHLSNIKEV